MMYYNLYADGHSDPVFVGPFETEDDAIANDLIGECWTMTAAEVLANIRDFGRCPIRRPL